MAELVAIDLPASAKLVRALADAWSSGHAVTILDQRLPHAARARVLAALAPTTLVDASGRSALAGGRPVDDGDALVVATSGTTGEPRGVVLTHAAVRAAARITSARLGVDPARDRWLACLPLAHVGGLSVVCRALLTGTPVVVVPRIDPDAVAAARATLVSLVPTALGRLDVSGFRWVVLGGAAPPAELPDNVVPTYGLTETGGGVVYGGRPLPEVEVRIGDDGRIGLRTPTALRAYRDGTDPRDADGWLVTGDVGAIDAEGRLQVLGRADDVIVTGGENVWPDPVEAIVARHPGVAEVAVVGAPDPEWGQVVVAVVVPAGPDVPPLDELRAMVKAERPAHDAPRRIECVDALPRTALGKVRRAEVRAALES